MRIEINWAWLVPLLVTVIVAIPSLLQVALGRRGNRLAESSGQGAEAAAWASLRADWRLAQTVAGCGLVSRGDAEQYQRVLGRYRDARLAAQAAADRGGPDLAWDDAAFEQARAEYDAADAELGLYRDAVERVLGYVGSVADRVVRRRLSLAVAYGVLGRDVVRARPALRRLLVLSADSDGCWASAHVELEAWQWLDLAEIGARIGWGDFLEPQRPAAARIRLLEDLLLGHAVQVGDAGFAGPIPLTDRWDPDLADLSFLPEVWRGVCPDGRRAAWRWTWKAAGIAHRASRRAGRRPLNPRLTDVLCAAWQARTPGLDPRRPEPLGTGDPAVLPMESPS